jgi:DNA-binding MarR family transcriptional regulator
MSRYFAIAAITLGAFGTATFLQAQQPGRNPSELAAVQLMGGPLFNLLEKDRIQKEIKLTADQKKKLAALNKEIHDAWEPEKISKLPESEQSAKSKAMAAAMDEEKAKSDRKVQGFLLPKQWERLKQIHLQMQLQVPGFALIDPQIAKALALTDDQKAKIKALNKETAEMLGRMRPGGGYPSMEEMKKMLEERKARDAKVLGVLTSEQKQKLEQMKGPKFDVSPIRGRSGGRGGNR